MSEDVGRDVPRVRDDVEFARASRASVLFARASGGGRLGFALIARSKAIIGSLRYRMP